jgi:hypothetical protein
MPDRVPQSFSVYAFHDHRRKADGTDLDSPQRGAREAIDAKTLSARTVRFRLGGKRRRSRLLNGPGRRLRILQGALKSPGLIGLKDPPIEQHDRAVTQRQDAHDKKEVLAPTENQGDSCRMSALAFSF